MFVDASAIEAMEANEPEPVMRVEVTPGRASVCTSVAGIERTSTHHRSSRWARSGHFGSVGLCTAQ